MSTSFPVRPRAAASLSRAPWLVAFGLCLPLPLMAQGGGLAALYAPDPPPGSAFVRVVNASDAGADVVFGSTTTPVRLPMPQSKQMASGYRVVASTQPARLQVNGKAVTVDVQPQAGSFVTWALMAQGGGTSVTVIKDELPPPNALRAVLRFTNLVPGCTAGLAQATGGDVFADVPAGQSKARLIQPVRVNVVARCDQAVSAPLQLPSLQPGDRYSLFVVGTPQSPVLRGQADTTEPLTP